MPGSPSRAIAGLFALITLTGACYSYQSVGDVVPEPGTEVRAALAPPEDFQLGEFTVHDVQEVEGQVYGLSGDSLLVSGTWLLTRLGTRHHANHGVLTLDRGQVGRLEARRFSATRSVVAGVAAVGVVALLFTLVDKALLGGRPGPDPDPY